MKDKINKIFKFVVSKFKKYFSTNILFSTYVFISLIMSLALRILTIGEVLSLKPIFIDLVVVIILGSLGYLIRPKNQFKYFFSLSLFLSFICIANAVYYEFYTSFLSVNLLSTASQIGAVESAITDKLRIYQFIYILGPIALVIVHNNLSKRKYYFEVEKTEKKKRMFLSTLITGVILLIISFFALSKTDKSRFIKQWNREYIVQSFGIYAYTFNDLFQSVQPKINTWFGYDKALNKFNVFYSENKIVTAKNKYTNVFEGKNVIFIHAESVQNFVIGLKINGVEVTPNLNKLSKNGLYFSSFYPQIGVGTSSDTEFTLSTGLMPSTAGTVFVSYADRTYEAMPQLFADKGYYTFSMHGNNADYWNRKIMHNNLGYRKFYAKDSYTIDETIGLGLSDKSFFKQITPIISEIKENKAPFMGTIITLTNHSPFNEIDKYGDFDLTMPYSTIDENGNKVSLIADYLEGTDMGNYIKSVHYADAALGELFDLLDQNKILDNTIIILYGDHEAKLGKQQFNLLYNYDPVTGGTLTDESEDYKTINSYSYDLLKNTPLIIWNKQKKYSKEIKSVMGMYDVLPTVANMFNLKYNYALGHDIFGKDEKIVIFPNGNFLTNKVYYNSLKDEYITRTNDPIESDYIEKYKKYTEDRLEISNSIIVYDLIKNTSSEVK